MPANPKKRTRGNGRGTVYQLPDGRWRWQLRNAQGKVHASGIEPDKSKAEKAVSRAVTDLERGVLAANTPITLRAYGTAWLTRGKRAQTRTSTKRMYAAELEFALEVLGHKALKSITPEDCENALAKLAKRKMGKRDQNGKPDPDAKTMSSRTLSKVRERLKGVFRTAVRDNLIVRNPLEDVDIVKSQNPDEEDEVGIALDFEQASRLQKLGVAFHEIGMARLWVALFTGISVGLRRGEIMALRIKSVNLEKNQLEIRENATLNAGGVEIGPLKTKRAKRDIPMPESLRRALEQQIAAMRLEAGMRGQQFTPNLFLFATQTGEVTSPDNLNRALENLVAWSNPDLELQRRPRAAGVTPRAFKTERTSLERRLKSVPVQHRERIAALISSGQALPNITPHDLRRTFATLWLRTNKGQDVARLSKILGHTKISVTLDRYRKVLESELQTEVIDLFGDN